MWHISCSLLTCWLSFQRAAHVTMALWSSCLRFSTQGAVTVLLMQVCRRVHSTFSSGSEPSPGPGSLAAPTAVQKCGYRILLEICKLLWPHPSCTHGNWKSLIPSNETQIKKALLHFLHPKHVFVFYSFVTKILTLLLLLSAVSRRDVLPRRRNVLCLQAVPQSQNQDQSLSSSGSQPKNLTSDSSTSDHQGEFYYKNGWFCASNAFHSHQIYIFFKILAFLVFSYLFAGMWKCIVLCPIHSEESPSYEPPPLQNDANQNPTEKKDAMVNGCLSSLSFFILIHIKTWLNVYVVCVCPLLLF